VVSHRLENHMLTFTKYIYLVYGGDPETPLFISNSIENCIEYMERGGLSSIQCYNLKVMEKEKW